MAKKQQHNFPVPQREEDDERQSRMVDAARGGGKKSKAVAKRGAKLPVGLDAIERGYLSDLQDTTKALVAAEPVSGSQNIIRVKNKRFFLGEHPLDAPLQVVVLATAAVQNFYETAYDPDEKSSPVCWARASSESELVPDPAAPKVQNDGPCATCKQNMPGSGDRGGFTRACSARRRLAVMFVGDKSDDPQWASLELSVTAIKGWTAYMKGLAAVHNLPYFMAVTELDFEDDKSGDYWHVSMRFADRLAKVRPDWLKPEKGVKPTDPGAFYTSLLGRRVKEVKESRTLLTPPTLLADQPKRGGGRGAKRRVPVGQVRGRARVPVGGGRTRARA